MSCDIRLHSEVKINGVWRHHSEAKIRSNYPLFAKMANVRNDFGIEPISEPKGLPDDATDLTVLHSEVFFSSGHSHSWLSAMEIAELHHFIEKYDGLNERWFTPNFLHENFPYFMGNRFCSFVNFPEDWEGYGVEDVRYVFFFDN